MGGAFGLDVKLAPRNFDFKLVPHKISTTIKRMWMNQILLGLKTSELKKFTKHWNRLIPFKGDYGTGDCVISFLCGRKVYRYWVLKVDLLTSGCVIDGEFCHPHWKISLHGRACTQSAAGPCSSRNIKQNKSLQEVPFCRSSQDCIFEEESK